MTTFDKREEGFEKKFALDEELLFKAGARRNKLLGLWAAEKLGLSGAEADAYAKSVVMADFAEAGDEDVFLLTNTTAQPQVALLDTWNGGAGFGHVAAGLIMEAIGRNLSAAPMLSTGILATTALVAGVPARVLRLLTEPELAWKAEGTASYQELTRRSFATMRATAPLAAPERDRRRIDLPELLPLSARKARLA